VRLRHCTTGKSLQVSVIANSRSVTRLPRFAASRRTHRVGRIFADNLPILQNLRPPPHRLVPKPLRSRVCRIGEQARTHVSPSANTDPVRASWVSVATGGRIPDFDNRRGRYGRATKKRSVSLPFWHSVMHPSTLVGLTAPAGRLRVCMANFGVISKFRPARVYLASWTEFTAIHREFGHGAMTPGFGPILAQLGVKPP